MNPYDEITELRRLLRSAQNAQESLLKVASATLLYHRGGPWSLDDRAEWTALTGSVECTTKALCDFTRGQLKALLP